MRRSETWWWNGTKVTVYRRCTGRKHQWWHPVCLHPHRAGIFFWRLLIWIFCSRPLSLYPSCLLASVLMLPLRASQDDCGNCRLVIGLGPATWRIMRSVGAVPPLTGFSRFNNNILQHQSCRWRYEQLISSTRLLLCQHVVFKCDVVFVVEMVYQGNSDRDATHSNNVFLFKAALIDFWPLGGSVTICCSISQSPNAISIRLLSCQMLCSVHQLIANFVCLVPGRFCTLEPPF